MKNIYKINKLYDQIKEEKLMADLISLAGKEGFRPRLEHLKDLLSAEISKIESSGCEVVVIAGTNGKGEAAHGLKYLLEESGSSVSLWSSPHVLTILERLYINGHYLSYERLEGLFNQDKSTISEEGLSFYEMLFYIFLKECANDISDFIILEVGLGGRFDGVNVFNNPLTAITSISLDHTQILGNTLKKILFEKYGVTRNGGRLISSVEQKHLNETLTTWCERDSISLDILKFKNNENYSQRNQRMSLELFKELTGECFNGELRWPLTKGRRERVTFHNRDFIFIGAHNLDGHRKMLQMIKDEDEASKDDVLVLSFSTGREDQIKSILDLYQTYPCLFTSKYLTAFSGERSICSDDLKSYLKEGYDFLEDWNYLLNDQYKNKKIYITGSYFFISEVQKYFNMFT
ncbi:MAG: hypothetical protein BM556_14545 [Bacteriovorax sp. MedPE-SWde]|nr:MAG: hypothetical protein BM556_14545 [Bacteriovorax sp. MedPE-SWde]